MMKQQMNQVPDPLVGMWFYVETRDRWLRGQIAARYEGVGFLVRWIDWADESQVYQTVVSRSDIINQHWHLYDDMASWYSVKGINGKAIRRD